ncbi:hypothetical protein GCM10027160_17110 [Streptomyces calidiresistens]|uniref:DUF317 domain-containing protein n=1 Tax=Streptomyces calidiresistens TaxID=1485586 RepID=A0A7W3T071_9ACTN|nr:DUF317 domain-containing protein [Streptomyces calidiresistens]MBB0228221.1 DUF317 domain-containing protein [Streptomyces calidiresistens]
MSTTPGPHAPSPTGAPGGREWLTDCHCAEPVLHLLTEEGWSIVTDGGTNIHCTSPDGAVYVGFLPETVEAALYDTLWLVSVEDPHTGARWTQKFTAGTPAQAVAGFVAALIATPTRACPVCR